MVPPLTTQNYGIDVSNFTSIDNSGKNDNNAEFISLKIQDGDGGSGGGVGVGDGEGGGEGGGEVLRHV